MIVTIVLPCGSRNMGQSVIRHTESTALHRPIHDKELDSLPSLQSADRD